MIIGTLNQPNSISPAKKYYSATNITFLRILLLPNGKSGKSIEVVAKFYGEF
jgi:hypothetical protein